MNFVLHGSSVTSGITIGQAHLVSSARLEVAHYEIPEHAVPGEIFRFDAGISRAKQELAQLESQIPHDAPAEFGAFINLHRMMLEEPVNAPQYNLDGYVHQGRMQVLGVVIPKLEQFINCVTF